MEAGCTGLFEFYRLVKQKWKRQRIKVKPRLTTQFQSGISKTRSTTETTNNDDSCKYRFNTYDKGASWSDLNQDILLLVMMQLAVNDFVAFSGVCKWWRSFALSNRCKLMAARSPMSVRISTFVCDKKAYCYLQDQEGRKFKTSVPYFAGHISYLAGGTYVGSTCGYLILFDRENHDFWLVNPITRHKLYFPHFPYGISKISGGVVVFSCAISRWVFVVTFDYPSTGTLFFSISGQGTWEPLSSPFPIIDLESFKGRIYVLNNARHLCELKLNQEPKLMVLEIKNFPISARCQKLVSSCKNLYLREDLSEDSYEFNKLDFDEMKWVSCEKDKIDKCAFIHSTSKHSVALIQPKGKLFTSWYIPMIV